MKRIALVVIFGVAASIAQADDYVIIDDIWRSTDPLAQRDEYGLLHQSKPVYETDFAPRYKWRWIYYFKANEQLILQPAYVGSMQTAVPWLGDYFGPIKGALSPQQSNAIAHPRTN